MPSNRSVHLSRVMAEERDRDLGIVTAFFILIRKLHLHGVINAFDQIDELESAQFIPSGLADALRVYFRRMFQVPG